MNSKQPSITLAGGLLCLFGGCAVTVGHESEATEEPSGALPSVESISQALSLGAGDHRSTRMFAQVKLSAPDVTTSDGGLVFPDEPDFDPMCPTTPDLYLTVYGASSGWSNVFGDFTEEQVACLHPATNELIHARSTITDANGDTVSMHFTARSPVSFPNEPPPSHTLLGVFDIMDGTGRWSGISGNGFIKGHGDGPDSPTTRTGYYFGTVYLPR